VPDSRGRDGKWSKAVGLARQKIKVFADTEFSLPTGLGLLRREKIEALQFPNLLCSLRLYCSFTTNE
jgi:hypothetical protein